MRKYEAVHVMKIFGVYIYVLNIYLVVLKCMFECIVYFITNNFNNRFFSYTNVIDVKGFETKFIIQNYNVSYKLLE